jgi:hypothetical protein
MDKEVAQASPQINTDKKDELMVLGKNSPVSVFIRG